MTKQTIAIILGVVAFGAALVFMVAGQQPPKQTEYSIQRSQPSN
jgi:hypothetical protein